MAHTFKRREKRPRPHTPTTTAPSTYAAEAARRAQAPGDIVVLAESKRDHKLDPVRVPNGAIAGAFTKEAEKYLVANPNALFKPPAKGDDAPRGRLDDETMHTMGEPDAPGPPAKGGGRWAKKHAREPSEFSKRVAECMAEKGMTQKALALAAGASTNGIWQMLNPLVGEKPRPRSLARIATALGVNAEWLMTGTGERSAAPVAAPVAAPEPLPTAPPKATAANPFPTAPPVNASAPPTASKGDRRLLNALADSQAAVAETLESFGLTQAASMTRLAAELIRRALQ